MEVGDLLVKCSAGCSVSVSRLRGRLICCGLHQVRTGLAMQVHGDLRMMMNGFPWGKSIGFT